MKVVTSAHPALPRHNPVALPHFSKSHAAQQSSLGSLWRLLTASDPLDESAYWHKLAKLFLVATLRQGTIASTALPALSSCRPAGKSTYNTHLVLQYADYQTLEWVHLHSESNQNSFPANSSVILSLVHCIRSQKSFWSSLLPWNTPS